MDDQNALVVDDLLTLDLSPGEPLDSFVTRKFKQLRWLAHRLRGGDMEATSLLLTAYGRLKKTDPLIEGDPQGFSLFSRAMRHALIDRARAIGAKKRGGDAIRVPYDPGRDDVVSNRPWFDLDALNDAIERLREMNPRKWEVLELKWFGGLCDGETAAVVGTSTATVERDWKFTKAWLRQQLDPVDEQPHR